MKQTVAALFVAAMLLYATPSAAQTTAAPGVPPNAAAGPPVDYSAEASWLCRPGRQDACGIDLDTTVVAADGTLRREDARASAAPLIDCFYVYPTVSTDPGPFSDMNPDPAELNVVAQQFARFRQVCRPFAPMYRQVTLAGLSAVMSRGGFDALGAGPAYDDVRGAWRHYLEHDNRGRGVVLIGHSQGAFILASLIAREIDGTPVRARVVSALLIGTTFSVPTGRDVGGTLKNIPLCRTAAQTGCVITYATFRSTVPAPANALFGRAGTAGMSAACTNPAALGGGSGELRAVLDAGGRNIFNTAPGKPWVSSGAAIATPWVAVPGLLTAQCVTNEHATFLEVTVHGDPADPRVDDITGDIGGATPQANWGLHLIDINLAMGNLLDIVAEQAKTFTAKK